MAQGYTLNRGKAPRRILMFTVITLVVLVAVYVIYCVAEDWFIAKDILSAADKQIQQQEQSLLESRRLTQEEAYRIYLNHRKQVLAKAEKDMWDTYRNNPAEFYKEIYRANGIRISPMLKSWECEN
jgi:hypothetical protein